MIKWLKKKLRAWCGGGYYAELPPVHIIQTTRPLEKIGWAVSYDVFTPQEEVDRMAAQQLAKLIIENKWVDTRIHHENANTIVKYYTMYVGRRGEDDTNRYFATKA